MACIHFPIIFTTLVAVSYGFPLWSIKLPNLEGNLRFKRQIRAQNSNGSCTMECLIQMQKHYQQSYPNQTTEESEETKNDYLSKYDKKELDKFCEIYNPGSKCLKNCAEDEFRKTILGTFHVMETLCITNNADVKKYMPCIDENEKVLNKTCNPRCQKYKNAMKQLSNIKLEQPELVERFSNYQKIFDDSCNFIKCHSECSRQVVTEHCGQDASSIVDVFLNSELDSLNKTTSFANMVLGEDGESKGLKFSTCHVA